MTVNMNGRRKFISKATLGTIGIIGATQIISSCSKSSKDEKQLPELLDQAPDGKVLKAGLVGCGGRGTGAALNFLEAGPNLEIVALGDVFQDRLDNCRARLDEEKGVKIADEKCFLGFDSFEKVIDSGVDIVLLCTPPHFRPAHVEAAINARKHVFMEKPCAVDPAGARSILVSAKKAESMGLSIVSGTIRRVQKDYMETQRRVSNGEIGEITGANVIRNGGALWYRNRRPEWSDMEYMLRNWVNFSWLSGDHIAEQFIHEIDVMNWHMDQNPISATGWGGRQRRVSGDQYDFFSIEYLYENGMRTNCAARQINGCTNKKVERISGTKGFADCNGKLYDLQGNMIWKYPHPKEGETDSKWKITNPFVQEHINLVTGIRTGKPVLDAVAQANSTLMAIMGRISAYTGKDVSWEEIMNSDLYLGPKNYNFGSKYDVPEEVQLAGVANKPANG